MAVVAPQAQPAHDVKPYDDALRFIVEQLRRDGLRATKESLNLMGHRSVLLALLLPCANEGISLEEVNHHGHLHKLNAFRPPLGSVEAFAAGLRVRVLIWDPGGHPTIYGTSGPIVRAWLRPGRPRKKKQPRSPIWVSVPVRKMAVPPPLPNQPDPPLPPSTRAFRSAGHASGRRLRVVVWNSNGTNSKTVSRVFSMTDPQLDTIFLISETKRVSPDYRPLLAVSTPSNKTSGGVAILFPPTATAHSLHLAVPGVTAVGAVFGSLSVVSVYIKCGLTTAPRRQAQVSLRNFLDKFSSNTDIVVGGDFNTPTPESVAEWEAVMATAGLMRVRTTGPTHVASTPGGRSNTLDHVFVSSMFAGARVDILESPSDHHALRLVLQPREHLPRRIGLHATVDHDLIRPYDTPIGVMQRKKAEGAISSYMAAHGVLTLTTLGEAALAGALTFAAKSPRTVRPGTPPWWTAEIDTAQRDLAAAEAHHRPGALALLSARAYLERLCWEAVSGHQRAVSASALPANVREARRNLSASSRKDHLPPSSIPSPESAEANLRAAFATPAPIPCRAEREQAVRAKLVQEGHSRHRLGDVTCYDVWHAIRQLNKDSVPGTDGVHAKVLTVPPRPWATAVAAEISAIIASGVWPPGHKHSQASLIPKKVIGEWRVICVGSTMSKLVERVVLNKVLDSKWFDAAKEFGRSQIGFQRGIGAMEPHILLAMIMDHLRDRGDDLYLLGLDVSRAFDSIDHVAILENLIHHGYSYRDVRLFSSFLGFTGGDRTMSPRGSPDRIVPQNVGVPCGAIVAPFLFLIGTSQLYATAYEGSRAGVIIRGVRCDSIIFADDALLFARLVRSLHSPARPLSLVDMYYGHEGHAGVKDAMASLGLAPNPTKFDSLSNRPAREKELRAEFPIPGGVVPLRSHAELLGSNEWDGTEGADGPKMNNMGRMVHAHRDYLGAAAVPIEHRARHVTTVIWPSTFYAHIASTHVAARSRLDAADSAAWGFILDVDGTSLREEARTFLGARRAVHEMDYMRAIRLIDAVRTTTPHHAILIRKLLLEEWQDGRGRPGAKSAIDLFVVLSPRAEIRGGRISLWMSLLLGDGRGGLRLATKDKGAAKHMLRMRYRLLRPPLRCPRGTTSAGAHASSLFAFAINRYPLSSALEDKYKRSAYVCLLCLKSDTVHHLLVCPGSTTSTEDEPVTPDVHREPSADFIAFAPTDAARFAASRRPLSERIKDFAPLLRSLTPYLAAHLRYNATAAATLAAEVIATRDETLRGALLRGVIRVPPASAYPRPSMLTPGQAPPEVALASPRTYNKWLWDTCGLRLHALGAFGSVLAAMRLARGLPPVPAWSDISQFKETVVRMATSDSFRSALGRGAGAFSARKGQRPRDPITEADALSIGSQLSEAWGLDTAHHDRYVNRDTFTALISVLSRADFVGPNIDGLAGECEWAMLSPLQGKRTFHSSRTAGFGSFAYEIEADTLYFMHAGGAPVFALLAALGPAGRAPHLVDDGDDARPPIARSRSFGGSSATPASLARTSSARLAVHPPP